MSDSGGVIQSTASTGMQFYNQDLQLQTNYSDGRCTIDEIVQGSIANGRKIIGITDHAIGWDEGDEHCKFFETGQEFKNYLAEIETAKNKYRDQGVRVLAGLEVEIGFEGQMALGKGILEMIGSEANLPQHLDYILGVIHSESFTVSLREVGKKLSQEEELALLMKNVAALIANPNVLIWGHPFQVVHGHYLRNFNAKERQFILSCLKKRTRPLLLEYNLNPRPRYDEWQGKSTLYETGELLPNDLEFFEQCAQLGSKFVVNTDAHDVEQTNRLNAITTIPAVIRDRMVYLELGGSL
jgi:histidinol phosphatase-like PHP family hydrolase